MDFSGKNLSSSDRGRCLLLFCVVDSVVISIIQTAGTIMLKQLDESL